MKRAVSIAMMFLLLLLLPLQVHAETLLIPVGRVIGLQLTSHAVTVAAFDESVDSAARSSGLQPGDEIEKIDGAPVSSVQDVKNAVIGAQGSLQFTVRRNGKAVVLTVRPRDHRLGAYLRQGVAGIGTVTWYAPDSDTFGALGHGVCSPAGMLTDMVSGSAFDAEIEAVKKGTAGHPGQLKGSADPDDLCGTLTRNTPQGLFGVSRRGWQGEPIPAAQSDELKTGPAVILSTIAGDEPREYSVEILKIYPPDRADGRNMLLKVTDERLLAETGGIVQGMSGSPIIQNGRLAGAVTHVLVNDPTMGYGIYIGNMLRAAA